jgi:hypothetical protein
MQERRRIDAGKTQDAKTGLQLVTILKYTASYLPQMKKFILILPVSILLASSLSAQKTNAATASKPIICLTYDDGLTTQLSTAIPQLDAAGFKATFFLTAIQGSSQSDVIGQTPEAVLGWHNAAKNGHELANHTLFHPCPMKLGWDKALAIDNYTLKQIIDEIQTQNTLLSMLDPKHVKRAYAFPCNNTIVEGSDYSHVLADKKLVTYARSGGDSTSIITDLANLNTMQVPSWLVFTGTTSAQLISFAEKVKQSGGMGVYQFHGIGGQIFQISPDTHKEFLAYLKANQNEFRILTFSQAMDEITRRKN